MIKVIDRHGNIKYTPYNYRLQEGESLFADFHGMHKPATIRLGDEAVHVFLTGSLPVDDGLTFRDAYGRVLATGHGRGFSEGAYEAHKALLADAYKAATPLLEAETVHADAAPSGSYDAYVNSLTNAWR